MGYWTTIHFFDDNLFKEYTVPALRNGDIRDDCIEYLRLYEANTLSRYTLEELMDRSSTMASDIQACAQCFDETFQKHCVFDTATTYEEHQRAVEKTKGYHDFANFFEYFVFKTCADFYPHLPCGRYGSIQEIECKPHSIAEYLVGKLGSGIGSTFFHAELSGIISWLTAEEVTMLYLDKENISSKRQEEEYTLQALYTMIDIAFANKKGLLLGAEMFESILAKFPSSKVIPQEKLLGIDFPPRIVLS